MRYLLAFMAFMVALNEGFTPLTLLLIALAVCCIPLQWIRLRFRQAVYNTTDWKIAITPQFIKEIKVIFGFDTIPQRTLLYTYRFYLLIFFSMYIVYRTIS